MPTQRNYKIFQRYMMLYHHRYNNKLFQRDDMYFCKIWKGHRQTFGKICRKYQCKEAYLDLNNRFVLYETRVLELKYQTHAMDEVLYHEMKRSIYAIFV